MALDFPSSPTNGQTYTSGGLTWVYDSAAAKWRRVNQDLDITGTLLSSGSVTNIATFDVDIAAFTGIYKRLVLQFRDLTPASNSDLWLRFSGDGGSTFKASASDYVHARHTFYSGSASAISGSTGDSKIIVEGSMTNGATDNICLEIEMYNAESSTLATMVRCEFVLRNSTLTVTGNSLGRDATTIAPTTDFRLMFSTGNISKGTYALYGFVI